MANYSALTFQDAWHHEICTLDHTSVCYVSLSKYLHMMPFWRQPDHYISRFYGDSTLQKLDAVTPDGDTAHHKKTIESEKLRASQNHNDTSKGCKLVAQPRPLLFSRHALCSRRSQRTGTDVCHYNSHIEKTWSRFKKKEQKIFKTCWNKFWMCSDCIPWNSAWTSVRGNEIKLLRGGLHS